MLTLRPIADMQHFRLKMGAAEFDCLFSTRGWSFSLALTTRNENPEFFLFPISRQYEVSNSMDTDTFVRLAKVLRTTGESGNKLIPQKFFTEMDSRIPNHASPVRIPNPRTIIMLRADILDERDKPYFSHWRSPGLRKDGFPADVSQKNRVKTMELLGTDALAHSNINKISSCWSSDFVKDGWMPGR